jgi:hypothetical protein
MTWTAFRRDVEERLQSSGLAFEQADLMAFLDANAGPIDCEPDPAVWAERFAAMLAERRQSAIAP